MAARNVDLSKLQPTPKEIADAKKLIAELSASEKRSKKGSLSHFLKSNIAEGLKPGDRGSSRDEFLEKFVIWQLRKKNAKKGLQSERSSSHKAAKHIEHHWWAREKMDIELGPLKGQHWRDSNKLTFRADSLTKSTHADHVEYAVPVQWESATEEELRLLKIQTTMDATEEDMNMFSEIPSSSGGGAVVGGVPIKKEPEEHTPVNRETAFMATLEATYKEFQSIELYLKQIKAKAEQSKHKYTDCLKTDAENLAKKVQKFYGIVERMLTEPSSVDPSHVSSVIAKKDALNIEIAELKEWAAKLGLVTPSSSSKRRRRGNE